jgi:ribokinase
MASVSPSVCVVGSINVDLIFRTPRLPRAGETLAGLSFQRCFGGKGANQAVTAARMGARVTMIARVGADAFGTQAMQNLAEHGIDVAHVLLDEQRPTGLASISVDEAGANAIIVVGGANDGLSPEDVRRATPGITESTVLVSQLETPIAATLEAFRLAKDAGMTTVLNPAPAAALPPELLQRTDLLVPNQPELEMLAGRVIHGVEDAKAAARQLLAWGPRTVVITLGDRGALVVEPEATEYIRAIGVKAIDTSGAGDVFIGTLAAMLAEERDLAEAVRWANAAAALSVTRHGTQTSCPRREEVLRFWPSMPEYNIEDKDSP